MVDIVGRPQLHDVTGSSHRSELVRREDWWAIWIGLGLIAVAVGLYAEGGSIAWIAVAPQKWSHLTEVWQQLQAHAPQYLALLALWAGLFALAAAALGLPALRFVAAFVVVFIGALLLYLLGQWNQAAYYNLEPPLVALALGLAISNTVGLPRWLDAGLRVELYIKTGIVLLGAGLPFTLLVWAGPVAIVQAAVVSLVTFGVIYLLSTRLGLDRRLAATLGTGGAVCGVSGSIAVGGAIGARKEHVSIAISLVVLWAIVLIFVLPLVARALGLPTGVAGAWIGTSEFADAAGLAAAQAYGGYAGHVPGISGASDAAINAFTLMKVVGRDIWIGVWALVLSAVATARWESINLQTRAGVAQIWQRFPKFVLGFVLASALITLVAHGHAYADYRKTVLPGLVTPLQALRTWTFTFAFLSIGLTTRLREFSAVGPRPFYAFTAGVVVNVVLGFVLSSHVFGHFWAQLGR